MKKVISITYASSLTNVCAVNSSFDTGVLRIAYTGRNRNNTSISKDAFERAIKTMYNCPVVCHYDRETDSLGGHDVELVKDNDGNYRLVNLTVPVGLIPESAKYWWDIVTEDDGTAHEYLYTEVLLWKRQEAYQKIKENKVTDHSMEITVLKSQYVDGVMQIDDFEFTAFALIGVTPCFESSALELFSAHEKQEFKRQLAEMMQEFKESFSLFANPVKGDDITEKNLQEGGKVALETNINYATEEDVQVEVAEVPAEETFEAVEETVTENVDEENQDHDFALNSNFIEELQRVFLSETVTREWGETPRYWYVDCDTDACEVYGWDTNDWLLYGFNYSLNGDSVVIDFESRKRKKYAIVDFDDGEQTSPFADTYAQMEKVLADVSAFETKYNDANTVIESMSKELNELKEFKAKIDNDVALSERTVVLDRFADLAGNESFEELREHCMDYDLDNLEEKCYAIRGRIGVPVKFSMEPKTTKLKVDREINSTDTADEPYGGIFVEYGNK